ncbi:hypothetical protein XBJ2_1340002 [Xenorhabdus bovienii str. Jollieti]|uniref:Uncharacterized protein n=1 Tax=Xenorhabdus bovienii (strain SS-2004) TaxID=406818 RepID=D3V7C0_XENBS|nr:hypothetical protein XBJ1_2608 [Xenorhabdus bovienii SS-2004]CDH27616.1 hypothetical protein XBJ2_1340002 [Xenorhabdus bovienii str. Jollieti]
MADFLSINSVYGCSTKRMVKKQQMQWSQQGAHYLLQTRTAVLNNDLKTRFEHWYPGIKLSKETDHYLAEIIAA